MKRFLYRTRKQIAVLLVFMLVAGLLPLSGITPMATRAYEEQDIGEILSIYEESESENEDAESEDEESGDSGNFEVPQGLNNEPGGIMQTMAGLGMELSDTTSNHIMGYRINGGDWDYRLFHWRDSWDANDPGYLNVYFTAPSHTKEGDEIELNIVTDDDGATVESSPIIIKDGVGEGSYTVVPANGDRDKSVIFNVYVIGIYSPNIVNICWAGAEGYPDVGFGEWEPGLWEEFSDFTIFLHESTPLNATFIGTVYARDPAAFVDGQIRFSSFDITLENGRASRVVEIISADGSVTRTYNVYYIVESVRSDKPYLELESLVIMTNTGPLSFDDFEIIEDPLDEYPDIIRFGIKAYVSNDTDVITAITANVTNGGELSIDQLFNSFHQGPGVTLPISLDEGGNHIDLATSIPGERDKFVVYCIDIYRECDTPITVWEIYYKSGDGEPVRPTVYHHGSWGDDSSWIIEFSIPSSIDTSKPFKLVPDMWDELEVLGDMTVTFTGGVGKGFFTLLAPDGRSTNYEITVRQPSNNSTKLFWVNGENEVEHSCQSNWERYSEVTIVLHKDTDHSATVWGIAYAEDADATIIGEDGFQNGENGTHHFDITLNKGRGTHEIEVIAADGITKHSYTIYFIVEGLERDIPYMDFDSLVITSNNGLVAVSEIIEDPYDEYEEHGFLRWAIYAWVSPETDTITAITADIAGGGELDIYGWGWEFNDGTGEWVGKNTFPIKLHQGHNHIEMRSSVPGDRNKFVHYNLYIHRYHEDEFAHTGYSEIYYQVDDGELLIGTGNRPWQGGGTSGLIEYVLPSSTTDYKEIRLTVAPAIHGASVEIEDDGLVAFGEDGIGRVKFTITAADGKTKRHYEVHVEISSPDNTRFFWPYVHSAWNIKDLKNIEDEIYADYWGTLAGWYSFGFHQLDFARIFVRGNFNDGYNIYEEVDKNALIYMRVFAIDGAASVKVDNSEWVQGGGWFPIQLTNGLAIADITVKSVNGTEKIYTHYFIHENYSNFTDGIPKLDLIEIKGNGKVLGFDKESERVDGWIYRNRYTTTVPFETDKITAIDIIKDDHIDYAIMTWNDKKKEYVHISDADIPLNLNVGDNYIYAFSWFKDELIICYENTYHIYRAPRVFDLEKDFGDGIVDPDDIRELDMDEIKNDIDKAIEDVLKKPITGETPVIEIEIDMNDGDQTTAVAGDDLRQILEHINEKLKGEEIDKVIIDIVITLPAGSDLGSVTIHLDSDTDPVTLKDVDLNFAIIPITQGTQFRNEDTNTKVTVPANSIIIAPPTHGEYGFEISFVITKAQWEKMGLKGSGKNFKLYYLNKDGIPVLADDENVKARMEFDGTNDTITVFISGASIYILVDETNEELAPEKINPISPGNNNQNNEKPGKSSNDRKPSVPGTPATPRPDFGSGATGNWTNLGKDLSSKLTIGTAFNHVVNTGTDVVVPMQIINTLRGTRGTVMFNTGTGVTFSISGGNIPAVFNAGKVDLSLTKTGLKAPASIIIAIKTGSIASIDIPMVSRENFGMPVGVHFNFGVANSGNFANLFRFNEGTGEFEYLGSFLINDKGQAMFGISDGADYIVTVTKTKPNLQIVPTVNSNTYIVKPGDNLSRIAVRHGLTLRQLLALNPQISNPNWIRVGQVIKLQ